MLESERESEVAMTPSDGTASDERAWRIETLPGGTGARMRAIAFDTLIECTLYGDEDAAESLLVDAIEACHDYERLFSRTLPSSDIGRLNAAKGEPVRIDARTAAVLMAALEYCEASEGAFDITVAPLVALWDLKRGAIADAEALREAATHVGARKLRVWAQCGGNWYAQLSDPKAAVDLGGIAKGWIADALGQRLVAAGARGVLLNLGGNVAVRGSKPDGALWRVGIRRPRTDAASQPFVAIEEMDHGSVVTSGTYERCFTEGGRLYHHILDPHTGLPVEAEFPSVSVVAERAIDAEGFSTTLLALGLEGSRELAAAHPRILQAYFVREDGTYELLRP